MDGCAAFARSTLLAWASPLGGHARIPGTSSRKVRMTAAPLAFFSTHTVVTSCRSTNARRASTVATKSSFARTWSTM